MLLFVFKSNVNFSQEFGVVMKLSTFNVGGRLSVLRVVSELVLRIQVSTLVDKLILKIAPPRLAILLRGKSILLNVNG